MEISATVTKITSIKNIFKSINKEYIQAFFIFIFILAIFFLSWNGSVAGYEPDTIEAAISLTNGTYLVKKPSMGSSLFYIPFVYIGKLLPAENMWKFLTLVPLFYSALTMSIIFLIANKLEIRRSVSIVVTVATAVGSLVWPYSKLGMEFQEMFVISILLLSLLIWSKKKISLVLIGAEVAFLTLTKSYGVLFIIPTLLFILITLYKKGEARKIFEFGFLARFFSLPLLAVAYIIIINIIFEGRISGAYNISTEFQIVSWWDGIWGTFFSFGKSILIYSPLIILSIFTWGNFNKKFSATSAFILSGFLLYFLITAPFSYWSDETPSVRKLIPLIPFLHLPLFLFINQLYEQKKKISLIIISLIVAIAIYIQVINSFYPYFRYMIILRKGNVDTLEQMRYNPQVSQIYINHRLFVSYLRNKLIGSADQYSYIENTWMRHFQDEDAKDFARTNLSLDLNKWNVPSIYIVLAQNKTIRNYILISDLIIIASAGIYLIKSVKASSRD